MELICLGSSSNGNGYILRGSDGVLLIECGIGLHSIKKALEWRLNRICGCLITHAHKDHSRYLPEIQKNGIPVLALESVYAYHSLPSRTFCKTLVPMRGYKIGPFKVFTLPVEHDVPCLGFIIEHAQMGKLLFVTDTMMFPYGIKGLNHIMIEANYCDSILQGNIDSGIMPLSMRSRLLLSHMELQTTCDVLLGTDMSAVREVILIHLSDRNSDETYFRDTIAGLTGKPTYVAKPGCRFNLSLQPY